MSVRKEVLAENVVVICGDNREILPTLGRFDACVTDPPYGIGFPYNSYLDDESNLSALINEALPLIREKATRAVITPGVTNIALYPRPDWTGCWTWETTATYGALGYSQWQPILFYGADLPGFGSVNGILKADRIHFTGGSAKINFDDGGGHTCPKPIAFVERLICRFTNAGETVCDPFLGSGTTAVAAVRHGRGFIGIELDERYFDIACRRISDELRRPRLFAEPVARPVQEAMSL